MVALNTAYAAPKNAADPKNRVGDFFYEDNASVRKNRWVKCLNTQEKSCYHYETASGRSNWPSRDPIGELGGLNLYSTLNIFLNTYDILGLTTQYPYLNPGPSCPPKCGNATYDPSAGESCCDGQAIAFSDQQCCGSSVV